MRTIHLASLDKVRPVLVLTREVIRPYLNQISVAPISSTIRGLATELPLGRKNGLDHDCVANLDSVTTISTGALGRQIGFLLADQEAALTDATAAAYDLDLP